MSDSTRVDLKLPAVCQKIAMSNLGLDICIESWLYYVAIWNNFQPKSRYTVLDMLIEKVRLHKGSTSSCNVLWCRSLAMVISHYVLIAPLRPFLRATKDTSVTLRMPGMLSTIAHSLQNFLCNIL